MCSSLQITLVAVVFLCSVLIMKRNWSRFSPTQMPCHQRKGSRFVCSLSDIIESHHCTAQT